MQKVIEYVIVIYNVHFMVCVPCIHVHGIYNNLYIPAVSINALCAQLEGVYMCVHMFWEYYQLLCYFYSDAKAIR